MKCPHRQRGDARGSGAVGEGYAVSGEGAGRSKHKSVGGQSLQLASQFRGLWFLLRKPAYTVPVAQNVC